MSDQRDAETFTWQHSNTQKWQTSMPPAGNGKAILASERSQAHALDRAVTGIDFVVIRLSKWEAKEAKMLCMLN